MLELRVVVRDRCGNETTQTVTVEVGDAEERRAEPRYRLPGRRVRIGQILLEAGVAGQAELQRALEEQRQTGDRLGTVLLRMGLGSQESLAEALALQLDLEMVRLQGRAPDLEALLAVPEAVARQHQVMPVRIDGGRLVLGMVDPLDVIAIDDVRRVAGMTVEPAVITLDAFQRALAEYPAPDQPAEALLREMKAAEAVGEGTADELDVTGNAPIVQLANMILVRAVRQSASDIHIEPQEQQVRVRFRVDGALIPTMTLPKAAQQPLCSRIKIMANLDIAEQRVPQDGRIDLKIDEKDIRLRVSTVPTMLGEKVVMRILDRSKAAVEIGSLGLHPADAQRFHKMIARPHGIILFTGPTGSGKTTSLYAVLNRLNRPEVNIVTIEDPVEYYLAGINQVEANLRGGVTFATGLRGFLRQDPDVIMVGEIRDEETARTAIQSALTGHLVLSTLHTNDAPSAVARLLDMNIEPFLVASSVIGIVAQRLVRLLCERCRAPLEVTDGVLAQLGQASIPANARLYRAAGCPLCAATGYRGRIGLFELMTVDGPVRELITRNESIAEIRRAAIAAGMRTLWEDGISKFLQGATSLEEVRRAVLKPDKVSPEAIRLEADLQPLPSAVRMAESQQN